MKKYVSDVIGKDYLRWKNGKVFINFPTGCGKSHFILNVFLPYLQAVGKRALILCNRKLLRQQYWYPALPEKLKAKMLSGPKPRPYMRSCWNIISYLIFTMIMTVSTI